MAKVLVDSSIVLALTNRADPDHSEAVETLRDLESQQASLFTTNFLRSETYTLLGARLGWDLARTWLAEFDLPMSRVTREDERDAVELLLSHDDKAYSFVDATSFVVMDRLSAETAFTIDEDFRHHGYQVLPRDVHSEK